MCFLAPTNFQSLTNCLRFATLFVPLYFQSFTTVKFSKSFPLTTIQQYRGCGGILPNLKLAQVSPVNLPTFPHFSTYPLSFHAIPNSFTKTTGVGVPLCFTLCIRAAWQVVPRVGSESRGS